MKPVQPANVCSDIGLEELHVPEQSPESGFGFKIPSVVRLSGYVEHIAAGDRPQPGKYPVGLRAD